MKTQRMMWGIVIAVVVLLGVWYFWRKRKEGYSKDHTDIEHVEKSPAHVPLSRKNQWLQNFFTNDVEQGVKLPDGGRGIFGPQNYIEEIRESLQDRFWHRNIRWMPEVGSVWRGNAEGWTQPTQNPLETTRQQIQSADERRVGMTLIIKITRSDPAHGLIAAEILWKYDMPSDPVDSKFPNQHLEPVLIPAWGVAQPFKHNKFILMDSFGAEIKWKFPDKNKLSMTYFLGLNSNIVDVSRERIIHPKVVMSVHCVRISPFKAPTFTRGEVLAAERPETKIAGAAREATLHQANFRIRSLVGILGITIPDEIKDAMGEDHPPQSDHEWYTRLVSLEGYIMRLEMMLDPLPPNQNGLKIFDEWYEEDGKIVLPEHAKQSLAIEDVRKHNEVAAKEWGEGITKGHTGKIPGAKVGDASIQTGLPALRYPGTLTYKCHLSPANETHKINVTKGWSYLGKGGVARLTMKLIKSDEPQIFYTMSFHDLSSEPSSIVFGYGEPHQEGVILHDVLSNCSSVSSGPTGCMFTSVTPSKVSTCQSCLNKEKKTFVVRGTWIIEPIPAAGLETKRLVMAAFAASNVFIRVTTPLNPEGELRGQILGINVKPF